MEHWRYLMFILSLVFGIGWTSGFKAAVFEHAEQSYRTHSSGPKRIIQENLKYYQVATRFAKSKDVDIIVFPEYGIFPSLDDRNETKVYLENIPDPNLTRSNPCEEPDTYSDRPILYNLSCMARTNKLIVVANMGDIQPCQGEKECPEDGVFQFNTNVAFDRNGTLLAKYHKEHLFLEPAMDTPVVVQDPTFETDFGRFAMFVCFDIVFKRITEVAHWEGVKAVLLSTMWMNSGPLFHSFQVFEAWAIGNNVDLLAANVQLLGEAGAGSGIMRGRKGAEVYTFNPDGRSKLLISDLSGDGTNSSIYIVTTNGTEEWTHDGVDVKHDCSIQALGPPVDINTDYRCLDLYTQNFTLQKLVNTSDHVKLCNAGMCCSLEYTADSLEESFYFAIFNGTLNQGTPYFIAEEICFVARCEDLDNRPCATFPMRSNTKFHSVYMKANFSTPFVYPTVISSGMRLLPRRQWEYETNGKIASIHLTSLLGNDLLAVGFTGRPYDRDPPFVQ